MLRFDATTDITVKAANVCVCGGGEGAFVLRKIFWEIIREGKRQMSWRGWRGFPLRRLWWPSSVPVTWQRSRSNRLISNSGKPRTRLMLSSPFYLPKTDQLPINDFITWNFCIFLRKRGKRRKTVCTRRDKVHCIVQCFTL